MSVVDGLGSPQPPLQGGVLGGCYPGLEPRHLGSASPAPGYTIRPFQGQDFARPEHWKPQEFPHQPRIYLRRP